MFLESPKWSKITKICNVALGCRFLENPKWSKITKILNLGLSIIREISQKALILVILKKHENLQFCAFWNPQNRLKKPLFWPFWRFLETPKWSKITKICNFALSGIRKIGQQALILAILDVFWKPKMIKNNENLQFCAFRNPQNRPKRPYFSHFGRFLESPKWSKITKIWNFALSGIRKIGQKALILAILDVVGKPKMVKNHENLQFCAFRNPQNRPKSPYFGNF